MTYVQLNKTPTWLAQATLIAYWWGLVWLIFRSWIRDYKNTRDLKRQRDLYLAIARLQDASKKLREASND